MDETHKRMQITTNKNHHEEQIRKGEIKYRDAEAINEAEKTSLDVPTLP